jgi:hypothetical protein
MILRHRQREFRPSNEGDNVENQLNGKGCQQETHQADEQFGAAFAEER